MTDQSIVDEEGLVGLEPSPPSKARGAWHGSQELKAEVVQRMRDHRAADEIKRGVYQEAVPGSPRYRGCLLGCTLPRQGDGPWVRGGTVPVRLKLREAPFDWAAQVERLYGIPALVGRALESVFEGTYSFGSAADFAIASLEAIAPGADLLYDTLELERLSEEMPWCALGFLTPSELVDLQAADKDINLYIEGQRIEATLAYLSNAPLVERSE